MDPMEAWHRNITRRRFFSASAKTVMGGMGALGLASVLGDPIREALGATDSGVSVPLKTHHAPKAKRVIYMHMEGGPSQMDTFDYKPGLQDRFDEDLPDSIRQGQRLTGMTSGQARFPIAPSIFKFKKYENNQDGIYISELMPHTAQQAKQLCFIHSMHTEAINHEPGITFFQTGHQQPGRPAFGAWSSYGLGSENQNLPSFVVLISQGFGNTQALSSRFWGSGFLSSEHQGVQLRSGSDPVLHLSNPEGIHRSDRRRMLDLVSEINEQEFSRTMDSEIRARIAQHEMAFRMQMSVPDLTDFSDESEETLAMYGDTVRQPGSFAANCLLARRLAERDVRFIQLYQRGWDQHGTLPRDIRLQSKAVDQGQAALVKDLEQRGLLEDTIVLWAGEFGRTVYSQGTLTKTDYGRDHHPRCFTVWLAGGGFKPGTTHGITDDYCYNILDNPVSVHDLHATMLHQLGVDHTRMIYRHQGRDYRLTDVFGEVRKDLLV